MSRRRLWFGRLRPAACAERQSCLPTRRRTAGRRDHRRRRDTRGDKEPGHHRVRVPHVVCGLDVSPPGQRRHVANVADNGPRRRTVGREDHRPAHSPAQVRDRSIGPAPDLISKEAPVPQSSHSYRAGYCHTAVRPLGSTPRRRHLDDEPRAIDRDLESGMKELMRRTAGQSCARQFPPPAGTARNLPARAHGYPPQKDRRRGTLIESLHRTSLPPHGRRRSAWPSPHAPRSHDGLPRRPRGQGRLPAQRGREPADRPLTLFVTVHPRGGAGSPVTRCRTVGRCVSRW